MGRGVDGVRMTMSLRKPKTLISINWKDCRLVILLDWHKNQDLGGT